MLTKELIRELFSYKCGLLYWKIKPCYTVEIGDLAGCICVKRGQKRRVIKIKSKPYFASRLIFLFHNGYLPEEVDHEDRNTLNDKIENLRAADHFKNMWNLSSRKNSSSKYLGVSYHSHNLWCARIRLNGIQKYLGLFKTEIEAALEYNKAALAHRGEFANLNKIETKNKTMINITIEGESAFDVRRQIQELLGLIPSNEIAIKDEKTAENFEASKTETQETQKPAEETTGKKRRTKAEIEAASKSAQEEAEKQGEAEGNIVDAKPEEETKASAITKEMLQAKAVELIRGGKKDQVTATIKSFDADSISQPDKKPVKVEDYAALMDAFNKIV